MLETRARGNAPGCRSRRAARAARALRTSPRPHPRSSAPIAAMRPSRTPTSASTRPARRQADAALDDEIEALAHAPSDNVSNISPSRTICRAHVGDATAHRTAASRRRSPRAAPRGAEQALRPFRAGRSPRCPARAPPAGRACAPWRAIHSPTGTVKPLLGRMAEAAGSDILEPAAQDPLAQAAPDLERVGQAEGELGDHRIEERRAALDPVRHQAAIELDQKIVGQPVGAIASPARSAARCAPTRCVSRSPMPRASRSSRSTPSPSKRRARASPAAEPARPSALR